ncbi:MAG: hypothetical protein EBX52_08955, partial [Proteobacteria bacterium]|nr:hypothetical protein [Pseudomonadota bacterium]
MPDSLYFEGQSPVFISNVEGDVYVMPGATAPAKVGQVTEPVPVDNMGQPIIPVMPVRPVPGRGGAGGLVRDSGVQARLDASADVLVSSVNSANRDALYWFVNGVTRLYLEGLGMGSVIADRVLKSKRLEQRARKLVADAGKLRKFEKSTLPSVYPSKRGTITILPDSPGMLQVSATKFFQSYPSLTSVFRNGQSSYDAGTGKLTFELASPQAEITAQNIAIEATQNPDIGAIVSFTSQTDPAQEQLISASLDNFSSQLGSVVNSNANTLQIGTGGGGGGTIMGP